MNNNEKRTLEDYSDPRGTILNGKPYQGTDHYMEDHEGFQGWKMILVILTVVVVIVVAGLLGLRAYFARKEDGDVTGTKGVINDLEGGYVDAVDGYESFSLDDIAITLPISLEDFMNSGFDLTDDDLGEVIEAHNSYGYPYYRSSDNAYLGTVFIYNTSNSDRKVKDGIVGGLTINNYDDVDLKLVGGLEFGSSLKDAIKVLGEDVTTRYVDGEYSSVTWQFSHGYSTSIELDYVNRKLDEVWIMKYDTLSDY